MFNYNAEPVSRVWRSINLQTGLAASNNRMLMNTLYYTLLGFFVLFILFFFTPQIAHNSLNCPKVWSRSPADLKYVYNNLER